MNLKYGVEGFPAEFQWGVATAAYQIEGAAFEDGRGLSIWDDFSHTAGRILHGDTGDVACDHYHRMSADIDLLEMLGVTHYRFSIAWPRILPEGKVSPINSTGLDFYQRLVDKLLEKGITPTATLYHWDLPLALQTDGGWVNRDTAEHFAEYAALMVRVLGDRVGHWITHNEPWCSAVLGHLTGEHAPGIQDPEATLSAAHNILLSHGWAVRAMRAVRPSASVGITLNLNMIYGQNDAVETIKAVELQDAFANRWYLDPIFYGQYPSALETIFGHMPAVLPDDMSQIQVPLDFLGINYYFSTVVVGNSSATNPAWPVPVARPEGPLTAMGWPVMPQGLRDLLLRLSRDYPMVPLVITENGAAYPDVPSTGTIPDRDRIRYLEAHIDAVHDAVTQGANVQGYYIWSFLDNFEWALGYAKRFGLFYVDFDTLQRIPKESAFWYRDFLHHLPPF